MSNERKCDLCNDYQFSPKKFKNFLLECNAILYESYPIINDERGKNGKYIKGFKNCVVCVRCEEELPTIECSICKNANVKNKKVRDLSENYLDYQEIKSRDNGFYVDGVFCINCYRVLSWKAR
ncbi:MAG: 3-phenylpropionate/cinnamic acid dioxygenase subunit beta [Mycoplasmataceae bacterium]|nr:MAG: 3-phenylpropionate/cinnamic acid dioxygenase subunit beta [Mycoplasmataceae bacterium]